MYARVVPAIRRGDTSHLVVYEPNLLFDYGAATRVHQPADSRAVLGFHDYCLGALLPGGSESSGCSIDDELVLRNALQYGARSGDGLLLGEWGGASGPVDVARMVALADKYLLPWNYWFYGSVVMDPHRPPVGTNVNWALLKLLVRPYPQVVAGTPTDISYNAQTHHFTTSYATTLPDGRRSGSLSSTIFIPDLQYPDGYTLTIRGGTRVATTGEQVTVRSCPGQPTVTIDVVPYRAAARSESTCPAKPATSLTS
jgi:endoglycosylceramidase